MKCERKVREQSDDEREKHAVCSFEVPSGERRSFFLSRDEFFVRKVGKEMGVVGKEMGVVGIWWVYGG